MWKTIFVCAISYNPKNIFLLYSLSNSKSPAKTGVKSKRVQASPFMSGSAPLFLRAEGLHIMDSYQTLKIKSVSFNEHLYFVNQLNRMNSTSMNRFLFYSNGGSLDL